MNLMSIRIIKASNKEIAVLEINFGGKDTDDRLAGLLAQLEDNARDAMVNKGYGPETCDVWVEESDDENEPNTGRVLCSTAASEQVDIDNAVSALREAVRML